MFKKVAIVGTGLIGGSLGLSIKENRLAKNVVGVSRHEKNILKAKKIHAIDNGSKSFDIIKGADLVILAMPVDSIINLAGKISKLIEDDCIVMDVGSTKGKIVSVLERIFPGYVGAHPMAGSEKRGISFADKELFKGSLCILTPGENTKKEALKKMKKFWQSIGAKTTEIKPTEHDKTMAFVSHLPHLAVFALMNSLPEKYLKFAAGGLKDTTRIAASDPEIWSEIFLTNDKNILCSLASLEKSLVKFKKAVKNKDKKTLTRLLIQANRLREKLK